MKSNQNRLIDDLVEVLSGPLQHSACEICKSEFSRVPVEFSTLDGRSWTINLTICERCLARNARVAARPYTTQ